MDICIRGENLNLYWYCNRVWSKLATSPLLSTKPRVSDRVSAYDWVDPLAYLST